MTSKKERLEAVIVKDVADRIPVALWRHFPVDDQDPRTLSDAIIGYQERYDYDFVKVTPASSFCLRDWGVEDAWLGNIEGTRTYTNRVVQDERDWENLAVLDPEKGHLGNQLACLELLRPSLGEGTPIVQTIFNPLSQAKNLAGEGVLFEHLNRSPEKVKHALDIITRSTVAFIEAAIQRGIDGIFFAVQHASYRYFDESGYLEFGENFDLQVLEAAGELWLNILHLHGGSLLFDVAERYPVAVVNWHDRESEIDLLHGSERVRGAVCGGIRRETMALGTPVEVLNEIHDAQAMMSAGGWILGTGCVTDIIAPEANYAAVRDATNFA